MFFVDLFLMIFFMWLYWSLIRDFFFSVLLMTFMLYLFWSFFFLFFLIDKPFILFAVLCLFSMSFSMWMLLNCWVVYLSEEGSNNRELTDYILLSVGFIIYVGGGLLFLFFTYFYWYMLCGWMSYFDMLMISLGGVIVVFFVINYFATEGYLIKKIKSLGVNLSQMQFQDVSMSYQEGVKPSKNKFFILFLGGASLVYSFFFENKFILSQSFFLVNKKLKFSLDFFFDKNSVLFFGVLLMIVFSVKEFSSFYLESDLNYNRFYWILMSFVFSMCIVIFIPNLVFLLIGWDGLGLTSFILIMYYKTSNSWFCGLKTYLINRLGDGLIFVWLMTLFSQGHWNILNSDYLFKMMIFFTIILGLFTKSAQFPFCSWLPAAMAAPTPVSALVHSSTLVTAGIFVLYRVSSNFGSHSLKLIGLISCYTMLLASLSACFEWDFKKIIAFSTLSQLGLMGIALSLGLQSLCFFHLLTHAVFKALLFISAGVLLGQVFHFQDIRNLSNMKGFNPLIDFVLFTSIMALGGFPFLAGFFSKDLILESKMKKFSFLFNLFLWISLPLTIFYSFRMVYFIWGGGISCHKTYVSVSSTKVLSVMFLFLCSCLLGNILSPLFLKKYFLSYTFKGIMLLLLSSGFLFCLLMKNLPHSWYFSNISFCEAKNTTIPSFFLSKAGNSFFIFDQGLNQSIKSLVFWGFSLMGNLKNFVTLVLNTTPLKSMFMFFILFMLNMFVWGLSLV